MSFLLKSFSISALAVWCTGFFFGIDILSGIGCRSSAELDFFALPSLDFDRSEPADSSWLSDRISALLPKVSFESDLKTGVGPSLASSSSRYRAGLRSLTVCHILSKYCSSSATESG